MSTTTDSAPDAIETIDAELESLLDAVPVDDESELEAVHEALQTVEIVLDRWEERATDWDDFEGYVKFRNDLAETLEELPNGLLHRSAFEAADRQVKTESVSKSLSASDFSAAREALEPARELSTLYTELQSTREAYRDAYGDLQRRRNELESRIDDLEELHRLGDADLDAPIEALREPISSYNSAVDEAFETARKSWSAQDLLDFIDATRNYPLVAVPQPPAEVLEYVRKTDAGSEPIGTLLEYSEYSKSKLSHYVDDPDLLKRRIATNRTYLLGLSADPLNLAWPPKPAAELRYRIQELIAVVGRLGDDDAVRALRTVRETLNRPDFDHLRDAALAASQLTDADRQQLQAGNVERDLDAAKDDLATIEAQLNTYPEPGER